jgi:hypothetical protein
VSERDEKDVCRSKFPNGAGGAVTSALIGVTSGLVTVASGIGVNVLSEHATPARPAAMFALAALLATVVWVRRLARKEPLAPLPRYLTRLLLVGAAACLAACVFGPAAWNNPAVAAATVLIIAAALVPNGLIEAVKLLATVAGLGFAVGVVADGISNLHAGHGDLGDAALIVAGLAVVALVEGCVHRKGDWVAVSTLGFGAALAVPGLDAFHAGLLEGNSVSAIDVFTGAARIGLGAAVAMGGFCWLLNRIEWVALAGVAVGVCLACSGLAQILEPVYRRLNPVLDGTARYAPSFTGLPDTIGGPGYPVTFHGFVDLNDGMRPSPGSESSGQGLHLGPGFRIAGTRSPAARRSTGSQRSLGVRRPPPGDRSGARRKTSVKASQNVSNGPAKR